MMSSEPYNFKMGAEDPKYLDAENTWEVNYWSFKLQCSKQELLIAAKEVGPKLDNIRQFIAMIGAAKKRRDNGSGK